MEGGREDGQRVPDNGVLDAVQDAMPWLLHDGLHRGCRGCRGFISGLSYQVTDFCLEGEGGREGGIRTQKKGLEALIERIRRGNDLSIYIYTRRSVHVYIQHT